MTKSKYTRNPSSPKNPNPKTNRRIWRKPPSKAYNCYDYQSVEFRLRHSRLPLYPSLQRPSHTGSGLHYLPCQEPTLPVTRPFNLSHPTESADAFSTGISGYLILNRCLTCTVTLTTDDLTP